MLNSAPARTRTGRVPWILVAGLLVVIAANAYPLVASLPINVARNEFPDALGAADGVVPKGTTIFDDRVPAVGKLNPALLGALRRAATDAEHEKVQFVVNSG